MSVGALAANHVYHARIKHKELDIHFVKDKVLGKELEVRYVPSSDQGIQLIVVSKDHP